MRIRGQQLGIFLLGAALFAAAFPSSAVTSVEVKTFPDGCGQAYQDVDDFIQFYESAIAFMAAQRKASSSGIVDLFAVSEMRKKLRDAFPNYSEESPVDKLIIAQICEFQKIRSTEIKPGNLERVAISSGDRDLHNHLAAIAPRLYKDVHTILKEEFIKQAKQEREARALAEGHEEVKRARELAKKKVSDLESI